MRKHLGSIIFRILKILDFLDAGEKLYCKR